MYQRCLRSQFRIVLTTVYTLHYSITEVSRKCPGYIAWERGRDSKNVVILWSQQSPLYFCLLWADGSGDSSGRHRTNGEKSWIPAGARYRSHVKLGNRGVGAIAALATNCNMVCSVESNSQTQANQLTLMAASFIVNGTSIMRMTSFGPQACEDVSDAYEYGSYVHTCIR